MSAKTLKLSVIGVSTLVTDQNAQCLGFLLCCLVHDVFAEGKARQSWISMWPSEPLYLERTMQKGHHISKKKKRKKKGTSSLRPVCIECFFFFFFPSFSAGQIMTSHSVVLRKLQFHVLGSYWEHG